MPPKKKQQHLKHIEVTDVEETQSAPETFQLKRRRIYEGARDSMKGLIATCTHQLEQARAQVLEFKLQETEPGRDSKDFEFWDASDEDTYKQWHKKHGASARELGYSRSIVVDAASKMLNVSSKERQGILHETLKAARLQVEQSKEKEKLATDASTLIRHYKNLLIGPVQTSRKK